MPEVAFVTHPAQEWAVRELTDTVRYELELQGVRTSMHTEGFPEPAPDRVYALAGPLAFREFEGEAALPEKAILKRTVFIGTEPPDRGYSNSELDYLRSAGVVFEIDNRAVLDLRRKGVPARGLKPGYSRLRDRYRLDAVRPIDVIFLGGHSLRRVRTISSWAPVLSRYNCLIHLTDDNFVNVGGSPTFIAEGRYDLLARTKVAVNLHADVDDRSFDWLWALDALHAGAVLVSEHSTGLSPLDPGQQLLMGSAESIPYLLDHVLRDTALQQALRGAAYERLSRWLPFALSIAVLRASVVELVGIPVPDGASRGTPPGVHPLPASRWSPVRDASDRATDGLRRQLRDAERMLLETRERLAKLQARVLPDSTSPASIVYESPGRRNRRQPRVSALLASVGEQDQTLETLEALRIGRPDLIEIVVVAAAGTDDAAVVREWLANHSEMASVLIRSTRASVAAARNLAVDHARAPYCLVMDPGNVPLPHAVEVLTGTLDAAPHAAFVYPMVAVDGPGGDVATDAERLAGYWGWEGSRLRLENFVHTPYLIRTQALCDSGGFSTDTALGGWEDYDLFCRITEAGGGAQQAPQILARHRAPGTAPERPTIAGDSGMRTGVLMEHAPRLMGGLRQLTPAPFPAQTRHTDSED